MTNNQVSNNPDKGSIINKSASKTKDYDDLEKIISHIEEID